MRRLLPAALAALLGSVGAAQAASGPITLIFNNGTSTPGNSLVISDASGAGETNYPYQFGRPFLEGEIPNSPTLLVNGAPVPTQADVKNRFPDGSVEFAVIATVVPSIPANGSVTLTFANNTAPNNTPMTQTQMLAPNYAFDTQMILTAAGATSPTATVSARAMLANGDYKLWTSGPIAQTIELADDSTARKYDVGLGDGFKPLRPRFYVTFWSTGQVNVRAVMDSGLMDQYEDTKYTVSVVGLGATAPGGVNEPFGNLAEPVLDLTGNLPLPHAGGTLTFAAAEPAGYVGNVAVSGTATGTVCADPPHYHALIEGTLEDVTFVCPAAPNQTIYLYSGGPAVKVGDPIVISLAGPPKVHWAGSSWTNHFWVNGPTPNPEVNINPGLGYLEATHYLPNYDTTTPVDPTSVANEWSAFQALNNGPYDGDDNGQGLWHSYGGDPGARPDIGPENGYTARWLTTSDWRARTVAFDQADIAGSWPEMLIETDPTRKLNRGDAAGTGLGHPASIIGRPMLITWAGDLADSLSDGPTVVGTGYDVTSDALGNQWTIEGSHVPQRFSAEYFLSGDPWYLREMEFAASYEAARYNPGEPTTAGGRGPDGTYGIVSDEPRGWGWVMRDRVEAEVAEPDGTALKTYYDTLTNDALAYDDGAIGAAGTPYDGTVMYAFGQAHGLPWSNASTLSPLHTMQIESCGTPAPTSECGANVAGAFILWNPISTDGANFNIPGAGVALFDPWMQAYSTWGAGRVAELGFSGVRPFQLWLGALFTGMINTSGDPYLISAYEIPSAYQGTSANPIPYPNWGAFFGTDPAPNNYPALQPAFVAVPQPTGPTTLLTYFQDNLWSQGRPAYAQAALAPLVDAGAPGAAQAWSWLATNVQAPIGQLTIPVGGSSVFGGSLGYQQDPSWDLVPRTDHNTLPAQPTTKQ